MITSEGNIRYNQLIDRGDGFCQSIEKNGNGGLKVRQNQYAEFYNDGTVTSRQLPTYNVGFGSTMPTAAWVEWSARQFDVAGLSTESFSDDPNEKQIVEINVPAANLWTVKNYGDTTNIIAGEARRNRKFAELYELEDERKARHKALRAQGLTHHSQEQIDSTKTNINKM